MKRVLLSCGIATALAIFCGSGRGGSEPPALEAKDARPIPLGFEDLLQVDWGKPGFCTEFATDYDPALGRCRSGGKPYRRRFISSE